MAIGESPWLQPAALSGAKEGPYGTRLRRALSPHRAWALGGRWMVWAQAIASRYVAQAAWRRPVGMRLARPGPSFVRSREVIRWWPVTLAPQINLGLVSLNRALVGKGAPPWTMAAAIGSRDGHRAALRMSIPMVAQRPVGEQAREAVQSEVMVPRVIQGSASERALIRLLTRRAREAVQTEVMALRVIQGLASERALIRLLAQQARGAVQTNVMMHRLLARGERVEGFGHPDVRQRRYPSAPPVRHGENSQQPGELVGWPRPAPRRPAMVFRRRDVAPQEPETSVREVAPGVESYPASSPVHNTLVPGPPPAGMMDANRLTDQVIQTLDRRLTAWRERMGRI